MTKLEQRIKEMNERYELPSHDTPTNLGTKRVVEFERIISEEIEELWDVEKEMDVVNQMVHLADLLADVVVYCYSEARRWGIPLDEVLDIVMDSNESKLGADGKPIKDARGKFLKGPNYWSPEGHIRLLLMRKIRDFDGF